MKKLTLALAGASVALTGLVATPASAADLGRQDRGRYEQVQTRQVIKNRFVTNNRFQRDNRFQARRWQRGDRFDSRGPRWPPYESAPNPSSRRRSASG